MPFVTVLGDGGWGTAFGLTAHRNGHNVTIWGAFPEYVEEVRNTRINTKYLDGFKIPDEILYETDIEQAVSGADFIVNATPAQWVRSVFKKLADTGFTGGDIISLTKGIERDTEKRAAEIIKELIEPDNICVVSGPSHAEEIARRLPASVVAASLNHNFARKVQEAFGSPELRIYSDSDMTGVEISGALKNVIAIAAGICVGLELGDNAQAALLTRGIVEMSRLGEAMGANPSTFYGLSGIGDLVTTCYSEFGRNRAVGKKIAGGMSLDEILESTEQVAEGVWTVKPVMDLAEKYSVSMPISKQVHDVLFNNRNAREAVNSLMTRDLKMEKEEWARR